MPDRHRKYTIAIQCCSTDVNSSASEPVSKKRHIDPAILPVVENNQKRTFKYSSGPATKQNGRLSLSPKRGSPRAGGPSPHRNGAKVAPKVHTSGQVSTPAITTTIDRPRVLHSHWTAPLGENPVAINVTKTPAAISSEAEMRKHPNTAFLFQSEPPTQPVLQAQPVVTAITRQETTVPAFTPREPVREPVRQPVQRPIQLPVQQAVQKVVPQHEVAHEVQNIMDADEPETSAMADLQTNFAAIKFTSEPVTTLAKTPKQATIHTKKPGLEASKYATSRPSSSTVSVRSAATAISEADRNRQQVLRSSDTFWEEYKKFSIRSKHTRSGF